MSNLRFCEKCQSGYLDERGHICRNEPMSAPPQLSLGMKVRFHPIIGGKHDGNLYTVVHIGEVEGQRVAWIEGKRGCVDVRALSLPLRLQSCVHSGDRS